MEGKDKGGKNKLLSRRQFVTSMSTAGMALGMASALTLPALAEPKPAAKTNWQQEWERTKAAAKKEGQLTLAASAGDLVRNSLTKYFSEKFGVSLEWIVGRSSEIVAKIAAEQRAGIYSADISLNGPSTILNFMDYNALQSVDPLLLLPEALDIKAWYGGKLHFFGQDHVGVAVLAFPQPYIFINTNMVKPGEVKGWRDLLDPKWKGKMILASPISGAGIDCVWSVSEVVMTPDYWPKFVKQDPIVLENPRQQCEWVARGKNPILVGGRTENMNEWIDLKSPVEMISPIEGLCLICSAGAVSLFKNASHPNAAKLFINWAMTKEGGTVLSKLIGGQSARLDVPTDFLDPKMVRQPGHKYFLTLTEESYRQKVEWAKKVPKEIFGPLMK